MVCVTLFYTLWIFMEQNPKAAWIYNQPSLLQKNSNTAIPKDETFTEDRSGSRAVDKTTGRDAIRTLHSLNAQFIFHFFLLLLCWRYIVTFTKVLTMYHSSIYPLHHSPLSPPFPIPGIVSICLIFPLTCMVHNIGTTLPSYSLSPPPPPTGTNPPVCSI
jgi:hypothetical protein